MPEVEFKWIIAASQSPLWRTAKGAKLCEIPLQHSYGSSNVQSHKWQGKNAAEVVPLTCCKALRKLFSLAGELQAVKQHGNFMPVFAGNVVRYSKICINIKPLKKKIKWKLDLLKLHYFHAMLIWILFSVSVRYFTWKKEKWFWGGNEPCGDLQRFKIKRVRKWVILLDQLFKVNVFLKNVPCFQRALTWCGQLWINGYVGLAHPKICLS